MRLVRLVQWALLTTTAISRSIDAEFPKNNTLQSGITGTVAADPSKTEVTKALWQKMVDKGCHLLSAMGMSDKEAAELFTDRKGTGSAESPFKAYPGDLEHWGYTYKDCSVGLDRMAPNFLDPYNEWGLDTSKKVRAYGGKPAREGANVCVEWDHLNEVEHGNVKYRPTKAQFESIVNTKDGVIIGWHKYGPRYQGSQQNPPVTVLPKLMNWSDVAFLKWKGLGGGSDLKYIFSMIIANSEFPTLIGYALSEGGHRDEDKLEEFDMFMECENYSWKNRKEFSMSTPAGKALLGSPNGRGAGHLLIEHKKTFGDRTTISHVTFFCSDAGSGGGLENWDPHLIFHVSK